MAAYLANGQNATQAAIAAGYSEKTAGQAGHRMLKNVDVAKAVAEGASKALECHGLAVDRVLQELARIVHFDPRKLFKADGTAKPVHELDADTAAAIASMEFADGKLVKAKAWDKNSALGNAMRYLGLMKPEIPLVPPAQPQTTIHATNVMVMSPLEAYQRMLTVSGQNAQAAGGD